MDIERNDDEQRYVALDDDGAEAGQLVFAVDGDVIRLLHTEVDEAHEGQGVGSGLARRALDDARSDGVSVDAKCPFVTAYIERHPEYADLVASR